MTSKAAGLLSMHLPDHEVFAHDLLCIAFKLWKAISLFAYPVILKGHLLVEADRNVCERDTIPHNTGYKTPGDTLALSPLHLQYTNDVL